jgi:hypothetical protein
MLLGAALWFAHPALAGAESHAPVQPRYFVAQLAEDRPAQVRRALVAAGYRERGSLPGRRLLLERVVSSTTPAAARDGLMVAPFAQAERVSRELRELTPAEPEVPVLIHAMPGAAASSVLQWLSTAGLPLLGSGRSADSLRVSTLLPAARAAELSEQLGALEEVLFVERVHHLGLFNDRSAGSVQAGMQGAAANLTPIWAKGLHGEGQIVGIIDTGVDADGCWFSSASDKPPATNTWSSSAGYGQAVDASHSKVIAYDFLYSCDQFASQRDCDNPSQPRAWDSDGHGTHCAGSMVGNRPAGRNNGMAPAAKLVVQDAGYKTNACADLPGLGCPIVDLYPLFAQAYAQGVRIHNNSYGDNEDAPTPQPSNYSARAQDVDRFVWDHKDMLLVFAAGNSGANDADFSVCSPSTSKNGLSVGSVRTSPTASSDNDISSFSSRGWTADGRIKPELMAPGCTTSAGDDFANNTQNCTEDSGCGTSYAAPILVGSAALVRQYLSEGFYPSGSKNPADALQPTAALLKALLINGAVPVTGRDNAGQAITPIPSNEQGWGRIQLDRALLFQGATRKLYLDDHRAGFMAGDSASVAYALHGVESSEPLKVTLTWTDFPGQVDAAPKAPKLNDAATFNAAQLVNDLDLSVSDGTATYLGNVFKDGASTAGGSADRRNNVEQVLIAQPNAGEWTLRVTATSIVQSGQDFALVVTGKWASALPLMAGATAPPASAGVPAAGSGGAGGAAGATGAAGLGSMSSALTGAAGLPSRLPGTAPAPGGSVAGGSAAGTSSSAASASSAAHGGCSVGHALGGWPSWSLPVSTALALARLRRRKRSRSQ